VRFAASSFWLAGFGWNLAGFSNSSGKLGDSSFHLCEEIHLKPTGRIKDVSKQANIALPHWVKKGSMINLIKPVYRHSLSLMLNISAS